MRTLARTATAACAVILALLSISPARAQTPDGSAHPTYWAYVANESSDIVSLVRFDGREVVEEKAIDVGFHPADLDGAHGITVSPTGAHWYVSIAHGRPFGQIWKMETGTDVLVDTAEVGLFPATMAVTRDGSSLFVVNFNLHGDHVPSSVSAVFTPMMTEVSEIETCVMPHGSRLTADGRTHYSTCMMSDLLVETSTAERAVTRRLALTAGAERVVVEQPGMAGHAMGGHGADAATMSGTAAAGGSMAGMAMGDPAAICKPTWVQPSPDDARLYVPCNGRGDVLEIDRRTLEVLRSFPTGAGPYNADITPDGRTLLVTLKGAKAVAIFDLPTGDETRIETTQPVTHGVAVTPDGRYAFVTIEAVGATRGTVDVVDIAARTIVASAPLHYQPGGLAVWKMEGGD